MKNEQRQKKDEKKGKHGKKCNQCVAQTLSVRVTYNTQRHSPKRTECQESGQVVEETEFEPSGPADSPVVVTCSTEGEHHATAIRKAPDHVNSEQMAVPHSISEVSKSTC